MSKNSDTVLIVEDEESYREPLAFALRRDGYTVAAAPNGTEGLHLALNNRFDIIILDVMLPGMDGTEVCRQIRRVCDTPIIMVTAKDQVVDRIVGLELGADDYVTKPYSYRELVARMRAVLRRHTAPGKNGEAMVDDEEDNEDIVSVGTLTLDSAAYSVTVSGKEVTLPLREFELLELLMRNAGRVLTRSQIFDRVWGADYSGDTKTLDVHVKRLRSRIEADPSKPRRIVTVRGLGYKLVPED